MDLPNLSPDVTATENLSHSLWCPQVSEQSSAVECTCGTQKVEVERAAMVRDALRWRWWCRWWLDEKDDMERINDLDYDGDDQASLNAAVDAEIARDAVHGGRASEP